MVWYLSRGPSLRSVQDRPSLTSPHFPHFPFAKDVFRRLQTGIEPARIQPYQTGNKGVTQDLRQFIGKCEMGRFVEKTGSSPASPTSLRSQRSAERRLSRRRPASAGEGGLPKPARCETSAFALMGYGATRRLGMPAKFKYVYVLVSEHDPDRHYTGVTDDLEDRLCHHNSGASPHTAKYRPWRIETCVAFRDPQKAILFESYLKTGSGREFARRHF
jgi:predicted GIY-YIG superfamily endonuclease